MGIDVSELIFVELGGTQHSEFKSRESRAMIRNRSRLPALLRPFFSMSLRTPRKFENLVNFDLFRTNCWNSEKSWKIADFGTWCQNRKNSAKFWNKKFKLAKKFDEIWLNFWMLIGAKACKYCRSRQDLSNEYLLAKSASIQPRTSPRKFGLPAACPG